MKKGKIVIVLLVLVLLVLLLASRCGDTQADEDVEEEKIQIGMSFDSFIIERWLRDRDIFVSTAKELGAEVNVQNANGDAQEQKRQIDYFINKGMDAIVIVSVDAYGLREEAARARNAGIKVISYDRLITDADVDLFISFDNEKVGTLMAEALVESDLKNKNVLMLGGAPTDSNVPLVENRFRAVMEENGVKILDSMHAEGWKAELAAQYIYERMDMVVQADAIMCGNDNIASYVVRALAEKRLAGDVLVVGQDGDLEACQRIVEGTQLMTVYKPVEKLARQAAEYTVKLIREEELTGEEITEIKNGRYTVPYVAIEPISVTKENMDEVIIDSGFHLREDVYLNVPEPEYP